MIFSSKKKKKSCPKNGKLLLFNNRADIYHIICFSAFADGKCGTGSGSGESSCVGFWMLAGVAPPLGQGGCALRAQGVCGVQGRHHPSREPGLGTCSGVHAAG